VFWKLVLRKSLRYGEIISKHPKIKTMTPLPFRKSYLSDTLGTFDAIVTFSSVEHSSLGRYGDALNPWGDIIAHVYYLYIYMGLVVLGTLASPK
jgi:hypothetical protein